MSLFGSRLPAVDAILPALQPGLTGRLNVNQRTALVGWLLDPVATVPESVRRALRREVNIQPSGVVISLVNFLLLNGLCCWLAGGRLFMLMLVANLLLGGGRFACTLYIHASKTQTAPIFTDLYVLITILWCLLQGLLTGAAMVTEIPSLQVIAASWSLSLQGPICARNYPAPRFAMAIIFGADLPFIAGASMSADHWLIVITLCTPSYLYASLSAIRWFQKLSIETMQSKLHSQQQARRDPLTGVLNRFGLSEALDEGGGTDRLSLFHLDLDGFKQVNDKLGHQAGDTLLVMIAQRLQRVSRAGDIVARCGGDEFVIVAPNMAPAAGEVFAARLVEEICRESFVLGDGLTATVGVSIGFACAPEDSTSLGELYRMADLALYTVKSQGKSNWRRSISVEAA